MPRKSSRRAFLSNVGFGLGAATLAGKSFGFTDVATAGNASAADLSSLSDVSSLVDFRYSPLSWQSTFCFPDDPHKSLVGERGDLRYGHPGAGSKGDHYFPEIVEFSTEGMEQDEVHEQRLEAPGVPIIHTRIDRPEAYLALTTFATNLPEEGRVDNVIMEYLPRTTKQVHAHPRIRIRTGQEVIAKEAADANLIYLGHDAPRLFMAISSTAGAPRPEVEDQALSKVLRFPGGSASYDKPLRYFLRFPQAGQDAGKIQPGLQFPDQLLEATRAFWRELESFNKPVSWNLPGRHGEFLSVCAQNMLQSREVKNGKMTFQVGPTVYRELFVVDGNFLLEAARYLGYDSEAQQGLEATWARQSDNGGIFAGAGSHHWKDTGIAMFSLARQAELSQDWTYFRQMQPDVLRAVKFLMELREKARSEDSANGRYGILPKGFGDGGLGGMRSELTNTLWVLAGLKAVTQAADRLGLSAFDDTKKFYLELRSAFANAARAEMRQHPEGFTFLPMLAKEDPSWSLPHVWDRPQPQVAQWALSHAIYPGMLFGKNDPIVQGHIALMQSCTQEDVPAETGWISHEGLWTYSAAFVAEVYLWAGLPDWAHRTFAGFLNHASPLYAWREEQPLRGSLVCDPGGDMPHNWASAECVRYLRHMLAMEDDSALRLLAGVHHSMLAEGEPYHLTESPTRFGRVSLDLEPLSQRRGWTLTFHLGKGPQPEKIELPATLGRHFHFSDLKDARFTQKGDKIEVAAGASSWQATWRI